MKISNSKKQLARIISENGGWRDGAKFAAQGGNHGHVGFASVAPVRNGKVWDMARGFAGKFLADEILPNWHQTVLSRDEYFHLYPAPDADVVSLSSVLGLVTDQNKHEHVDSKPTIEQLASDYRNAKDYADRKQQEADAAKAKLAELVAAGKALGLALSVAEPEPEPELVITDWRDLRVGDEVECIQRPAGATCTPGMVGVVVLVDFDGVEAVFDEALSSRAKRAWFSAGGKCFRFIRRPAKEVSKA